MEKSVTSKEEDSCSLTFTESSLDETEEETTFRFTKEKPVRRSFMLEDTENHKKYIAFKRSDQKEFLSPEGNHALIRPGTIINSRHRKVSIGDFHFLES